MTDGSGGAPSIAPSFGTFCRREVRESQVAR
jgi:hypothetical protein